MVNKRARLKQNSSKMIERKVRKFRGGIAQWEMLTRIGMESSASEEISTRFLPPIWLSEARDGVFEYKTTTIPPKKTYIKKCLITYKELEKVSTIPRVQPTEGTHLSPSISDALRVGRPGGRGNGVSGEEGRERF